jgi:hypothetical protein
MTKDFNNFKKEGLSSKLKKQENIDILNNNILSYEDIMAIDVKFSSYSSFLYSLIKSAEFEERRKKLENCILNTLLPNIETKNNMIFSNDEKNEIMNTIFNLILTRRTILSFDFIPKIEQALSVTNYDMFNAENFEKFKNDIYYIMHVIDFEKTDPKFLSINNSRFEKEQVINFLKIIIAYRDYIFSIDTMKVATKKIVENYVEKCIRSESIIKEYIKAHNWEILPYSKNDDILHGIDIMFKTDRKDFYRDENNIVKLQVKYCKNMDKNNNIITIYDNLSVNDHVLDDNMTYNYLVLVSSKLDYSYFLDKRNIENVISTKVKNNNYICTNVIITLKNDSENKNFMVNL